MALAGWRSAYRRAQVVQGGGQGSQPLGIVRRGAEKLLLQRDGAGDRSGGAFRIARLILQQTQIAVGQGQIGETSVRNLPPRGQDFFLQGGWLPHRRVAPRRSAPMRSKTKARLFWQTPSRRR